MLLIPQLGYHDELVRKTSEFSFRVPYFFQWHISIVGVFFGSLEDIIELEAVPRKDPAMKKGEGK